jgi:uncharacterized caspase-like protein/uncharacterized membrane protein
LRRFVLAAAAVTALVLVLAAPAARAQEKRVALVIGNASYAESPLKNPANDARAMARRLKELGFDVMALENASRAQMGRAVIEFGRKLGPTTVALFFYAGHGIQARGRNYLIPVDATLAAEGDLRFQAVEVTALLEEIENSKSQVGFVVLDACRNNPFERKLRGAGTGGGLAAIDAARGMMIAYATAPGSVASDGEGENGTYTAALLRALAEPGLSAEQVFKRVRVEVSDRTQNVQVPWESSSLTGEFVFHRPPAGARPAAAPADREAIFWQAIQASRRASDFEAYLGQFPQGMFAALARARLEELKKAPPAQPQQTASLPAPGGYAVEPIDKEFVAKSAARIRAAPDVNSPVIATLKEGDSVHVLGKVKGHPWYAVERENRPPAFVSMGLFVDADEHRKQQKEEERVRALAAEEEKKQQQAAVPPPAEPEPDKSDLVRTVRVCNRTDKDAFVAFVYRPVGEDEWWNEGWFTVPKHDCREPIATNERYVYFRAEEKNGSGTWGGDQVHCVVYPGPFKFVEPEGKKCRSGQKAMEFDEIEFSEDGELFTQNLDP